MSGQWGRFWILLLRDALVIAFTAWLWTRQDGGWLMAGSVALLTTLCGFLLHEWGHLIGAMLARAAFELPTAFESPFLFRFDRDNSSRPQFFSMALGGFVSSILFVAALMIVLPWSLLASKIALTLVGIGVLATLVIEVPEFLRVWNGAPVPNGAAFVSAERPRKH